MTSGEKLIVSILDSLSNSMAKIADELQKVREVVTYDHRKKISEERKARLSKNGMVTESTEYPVKNESVISQKDAVENIHDILNGKYIH